VLRPAGRAVLEVTAPGSGQNMELRTQIKAGREVISTEIDGEAVLMDVAKGVYYGLNAVAAVVWGGVSSNRPRSERSAPRLRIDSRLSAR